MSSCSIKVTLLTLFLGIGLTTHGQTIPTIKDGINQNQSQISRELILKQNGWLSTSNPSGIGVFPIPDMGFSQIEGNYLGGNYRRVQEANTINSVGFTSDSYRSLEKIALYGNFCFTQQKRTGIRYADNLLPYDCNPYILGNSIPGEYSNQYFRFKVKASSYKLKDLFWAGIGFDYDIGDYSRLQDPRSRVPSVDINIKPGIIFQIGDNSKIGFNLLYRYRKEKSENYVAKSQDSKQYLIYRQEGLGVYSTIVSTSITRRIKGNYYGGEVQYEHEQGGNSYTVSVGGCVRADNIEDVNRSSPGEYSNWLVEGKVTYNVRISGKEHYFTLEGKYISGKAKKSFQEVVTTQDPESGVISSYYHTLFQVDSYINDIMTSGISHRFYPVKNSNTILYIGSDVHIYQFNNDYIYLSPSSSQSVCSVDPVLNGGISFLTKDKSNINIRLSAGYLDNIKNTKSISSTLQDKEIVENVVEPDADIMNLNALHFSLDLNYSFRLSKKGKTLFHFSPYYTHYAASGGKSRQLAGISLGLIY